MSFNYAQGRWKVGDVCLDGLDGLFTWIGLKEEGVVLKNQVSESEVYSLACRDQINGDVIKEVSVREIITRFDAHLQDLDESLCITACATLETSNAICFHSSSEMNGL